MAQTGANDRIIWMASGSYITFFCADATQSRCARHVEWGVDVVLDLGASDLASSSPSHTQYGSVLNKELLFGLTTDAAFTTGVLPSFSSKIARGGRLVTLVVVWLAYGLAVS